jgi:hypothetical protein
MRRTAAASLALATTATLTAAAATSLIGVAPPADAVIDIGQASTTAATTPPERSAETRDVMFVGNNWEGTATIVDARTHRRIRTIDMIPDKDARMAEIATTPDKLAFYLAIQQGVGEGTTSTDDMFTTHDGASSR